jgi:hypothetical protein
MTDVDVCADIVARPEMQKTLRYIVAAIVVTCFSGFSTVSAADIVYPDDPTGNPRDYFDDPHIPATEDSFFPFYTSSGNTVTVNSGTIIGNVYGGITDATGGAASNNRVFINGGTIGSTASGTRGNVTGGWSAWGHVENNTIEITNAVIRGIVYGGYIEGGTNNDVKNNSVEIWSGTTRSSVYGAYSRGSGGILSGNTVTFWGGTFATSGSFIDGAYSAIGTNTITDNSDRKSVV